MGKRVYAVGTADTKGDELAFLADAVAAAGVAACASISASARPRVRVDVAASEVAAAIPEGAAAVLGGDDRGAAVAAMSEAFARFIETRDDIAGIVGIGGGGGTAIVTAGMRAPAARPAQDHGLDACLRRRRALTSMFPTSS